MCVFPVIELKGPLLFWSPDLKGFKEDALHCDWMWLDSHSQGELDCFTGLGWDRFLLINATWPAAITHLWPGPVENEEMKGQHLFSWEKSTVLSFPHYVAIVSISCQVYCQFLHPCFGEQLPQSRSDLCLSWKDPDWWIKLKHKATYPTETLKSLITARGYKRFAKMWGTHVCEIPYDALSR